MFGDIVAYVSEISGIIGAVVMGIQGVRFLNQKRRYEKKIESLSDLRQDNSDYVINMSGHPMNAHSKCVGNWLEGKTVITVHPNVNQGKAIQEQEELIQEAERLISSIPKDVLDRITRASAVIFALPGMSMLTQILLVKLHAVQGVFPVITVSLRDGDSGEFIWHSPLDLQHVRTKHRKAREELNWR